MTKRISTKRALLLSGLALLLCISMLVGSTFAWFTDSVTSAGNKIVAGTLDVQLFMHNGTDYVDISNSDKPIFGEGSLAQNDAGATLWEPGKTQIVYLQVKNAGSLALKYNILVDVTDNGLANALQYAILDGVTKEQADTYSAASWNDILAISGVQAGNVADGRIVASEHGAIEPNGSDYFALAIHMDEEAGNEYQGKDVVIDIQILATQLTYESDSFDDQYDADAELPVVGSADVPENAPETTIPAGKVKVQLPAASPAGVYTVRVSNEAEAVNDEGQTVFSADIDLLKDGVKVERNGNTKYLVMIDIGPDKQIVEVLHKDQAIADFSYDAATGIIQFETDSFSPFSVVYKVIRVVKVDSAEALMEALANVTEETVIDATGVTLVPTDDKNTTLVIPAGVTIKGAKFAPNGACWLLIGEGDQAVVFEDCTFTGLPLDQFKIATNGCDDITYTNCTFTGLIMINNCDNRDAVNTLNNCSFGLTEGFKVGYVNCMAATSIFNQCTFDYTGGSNMNMGVTKLNAVNAYSENTNTLESHNYTTYVELNGCVRNNCTTYANTSNSTLVVR